MNGASRLKLGKACNLTIVGESSSPCFVAPRSNVPKVLVHRTEEYNREDQVEIISRTLNRREPCILFPSRDLYMNIAEG